MAEPWLPVLYIDVANGFPPTIVVIDAGDRLLLLDRPANDAEYQVYRLPREAFADARLERAELFTQGTLLGELATSHLEFDESRSRAIRASSIQQFLVG